MQIGGIVSATHDRCKWLLCGWSLCTVQTEERKPRYRRSLRLVTATGGLLMGEDDLRLVEPVIREWRAWTWSIPVPETPTEGPFGFGQFVAELADKGDDHRLSRESLHL